ncbi:MAG: hypothetical protein CM1200mP2_06300 [Planctomycetaceae bacterium]|nr:MAG: hypothetical protein CM1200mP2_06300 [Planctomycetaceae bacterium]
MQLREQFNAFDTEARQIGGTWSQNTIINNVGSGVSADARMAGLVIGIDGTDPSTGASLGNTITDNGADGIEINGFGDVVVANNSITGNGVLALGAGGGAGIDINWAPPAQAFTFIGKQFTLRGNTIQDNAGDGIEIQQAGALAGSQRLELVAESNDIRFNDLRGVDILNQDSGESFIRFGNGTSDGQNQIDNNGLEGFYVVNTASAVQNQIDTADVDLDATGAIDALPNMVLVLDENSVENNNQTGNFIAGGPGTASRYQQQFRSVHRCRCGWHQRIGRERCRYQRGAGLAGQRDRQRTRQCPGDRQHVQHQQRPRRVHREFHLDG